MSRINRNMFRGVIAGLAMLLLLAGCAPAVTPSSEPAATSGAGVPTSAATQPLTHVPSSTIGNPLTSVADVVAKVKPSVVAINTELVERDIFNRPVTAAAAGSGWIISQDGYIVTNNHVVEGATTVTVVLDDGRSFEADAVYTDPPTDLAVIKISATGLPVVDIGDSAALRVGDAAVAIGNSLGMGISATSGIVSAAGVSLAEQSGQTLLDLIQTDAAINPGNSGGPLVNSAGQVIGINSIKIATVGVEGMGYAISINQALPIIDSLIGQGYVVRPWVGLGLYTVDPFIAARYSLPVTAGVLVTEVASGGPADAAGLEVGDVIVSIDGVDVQQVQDLTDVVYGKQVGDNVDVRYWRGDQEKVAQLVLATSPAA